MSASPPAATARSSSADAPSHASGRALLDALQPAFDGLDAKYELAAGETTRRTYLDSAASSLRLRPAARVMRQALGRYANTHSKLHFGAHVMTRAYEQAHEAVLDFVGADPEQYTAVFCGHGVTAGLNRMARQLLPAPDRQGQEGARDVVITTMMEHHANDLPHRKHAREVVHVPLETDPGGRAGRVDMQALERAIQEHADRLAYVAIPSASNVTGVTNPVREIARRAHEAGARVVVDAAQSAAHMPIPIYDADSGHALDVVCLSGHKIYAPGSPGVIVARKELFEGQEPQTVGGGIVSRVETDRYQITDRLPEREEAGTPNLPGAFLLAATLRILQRVGMDTVAEHERELTQHALSRFSAVDGLTLYGAADLAQAERIGVMTFNLRALPHGLVAAALNDYFGLAVRNECFCAQPLVRRLLGRAGAGEDHGAAPAGGDGAPPAAEASSCDLPFGEEAPPHEQTDRQPGMVRASLGLYNTKADIDYAADALDDLAARPDFYRAQYRAAADGSDWTHKTFRFVPAEAFDLDAAATEAAEETLEKTSSSRNATTR
ncbi:MAG: aminotransferase [Bacteroidetes bacterium QS_8_68_15]|nr:MAG: aminotransferase [Bacteroidetes bacterium QS_8_68_15]